MNIKLISQALIKFLFGFMIICILLFIPAGTLNYLNAWLFIAVLFIPMLIMGVFLFIKNPELLKKRLNSKETEDDQKHVILLSGIMFTFGFITAGLNYRFKWIILPGETAFIAAAVFILSYILYAEVMRENIYLSRTIEVQDNQKVIDTGLYGIVRHPMYSATVLMFLSIPIILGSLLSFFIFCLYIPIILKRIKNEEEVLKKELSGYEEYKNRVKYRIIPFIW